MINSFRIQTYSGGSIDLLHPEAKDVLIEDIAHALSNLNRYTGHSRIPYSVASHSLHVGRLVRPELRAHAKVHDAHEAYTGDLSTILKRVIRFLGGGWMIDTWEDRFDRVIYQALGLRALTQQEREEIKWADRAALTVEHRFLMPQGLEDDRLYWPFVPWEDIPEAERVLQPGYWWEVEAEFLRELRAIRETHSTP